jgi:hypothetical protein
MDAEWWDDADLIHLVQERQKTMVLLKTTTKVQVP